ncbi:hypothetical protein BQ8794_70025 [Mesorhizobium prunaredense]|uniref:Uncharacterized protein n=1 Tax=Mesorhizobium prunaredense TaxID=1631249 RepID=A0A1R3VGP0_9HYPH|nr:hypothetical protein BQ8794_70025 [Mesorhizobium prunaredense]
MQPCPSLPAPLPDGDEKHRADGWGGPSGRRKHHRDLIQADVSAKSGVAQMGSIASDVVLTFGPPLGSRGKDAL